MEDMDMQPAEAPRGGWKAVYTIVERPGLEKKFWVRIGTAFINRDQSLSVRLDASPTNGQLHIRDAEPSPYASRREPARPTVSREAMERVS